MFIKKIFIVFIFLVCLLGQSYPVIAQETKYPDYAYEYVGMDKWENFNRKMFNFNLLLNKYAIRPLHIIWSSIMPEYGMDRIQSATNNIEYPIRLVSSLLQRDFETSKTETIRFFTNTIIGLGGLYDPAKSLFHIEPAKENMEQALAGCNLKQGPFLVLPVIAATSLRGVLGRILDTALNPGSYIATPVLAIVKAGLTVNRTSYMQPLIKMVESTYADPYDIAKKIYGLEGFIRCANLDRINITGDDLLVKVEEESPKVEQKPVVAVKETSDQQVEKPLVKTEVSSQLLASDFLKGGTNIDEFGDKNYSTENFKLGADIFLPGYNPQSPVIDSMRTALFDLPGVDESIWNELSIWNRCFSKRIKTSSINVVEGKDNYTYRHIMQKDKSSPVAIIYPSIGEGIMSSHSVLLAKIFYDKGYSVVIQGSHFQWEFVKSMPDGYKPGLPAKDAESLRLITTKILESLESKYECHFEQKVVIGTSFGALTALFVGAQEEVENTLGNLRIISICPPVELIYAMKQIDKNSEEWGKSSDDLKQRVARTAAKVLKLYESRDSVKEQNLDINYLPFSEDEAKIITGFIMHQKLSDLIFTIEKASKSEKSDIYNVINNMNYQDYAEKYLLGANDSSAEDLSYEVSLHSISDFLQHNNSYKIYHSLNDYLTNTTQLKRLKEYSGNKVVLLDNGSHLGFLYRKEFLNDLKDTISNYKSENIKLIIPELNPDSLSYIGFFENCSY